MNAVLTSWEQETRSTLEHLGFAPRCTTSPAIQRVNPLEMADWDTLVRSHPASTIFHSAGWARVLHDTYGFKPIYFAAFEDRRLSALLPCMEVNTLFTGRRGVCLPFTDTCEPLTSNAIPSEALLSELAKCGRERRWKSIECRGRGTPPVQSPASLAFYGHELPLADGEEQVFGGFDSAVQRAIRKAEKSGVYVEISRTLGAMRSYYRLHCMTRKRHGLPPQSWSFFARLHQHVLSKGHGFVAIARLRLPRVGKEGSCPTSTRPPLARAQAKAGTDSLEHPVREHLGRDASDEATHPIGQAPGSAAPPTGSLPGTPIAGVVILLFDERAVYKYAASDETFQQYRGNNLALWRAIQCCARWGYKTLDFGRTSLENEGLRQFKLGWGSAERRIEYLKYDLRHQAYLTEHDRTRGWHTRFFRLMPLPVSRLLGALLYPHLA